MSAWRHPVLWSRAHPRHLDLGLAAGLVALTVLTVAVSTTDVNGDPATATAWSFVFGVAGTVPVAWRRRAPVAVLAVTVVTTFVSQSLHQPESTLTIAPVVAAYSVGAYVSSRRRVRLVAGVLLGTLGLGNLVTGILDRRIESLIAIVANAILFGAAFLFGDNIRRRRERIADLEARAAVEETVRLALAREAVNEERRRIARELHDVVAHSLSVMVVQAGAARRLVTGRPERAVEALSTIETTGREALDEMRRLLGVLRTDEAAERAHLEPQPSLARLGELAAADPDLAVDLVVEGAPVALPAAVDLQAYRIVQEALTNVRKHAGPARATVVVRYALDALEVRVDDDGRGASAAIAAPGAEADHPAGHGLVGMRERAALCGGEFRAGPRAGGGWSVSARLPLAVREGAA